MTSRYTRPTGATRKRVIARDRGICQSCRRGPFDVRDLEVDHRVPLDDGGSNLDENLQTLCRPCHARKSNRKPHPVAWVVLSALAGLTGFALYGVLVGELAVLAVWALWLLTALARWERRRAGQAVPLDDPTPTVQPTPEPAGLVIPPPRDRQPGHGDPAAIPVATTPDGQTVTWNITRDPHALVTGETGGGKTSAMRTLVEGLLEAGCLVAISDPKRIEYLGYKDQGIRVETTPAGIAALISETHREMERRYEAVENGRPIDDLERLVLVLDEWATMDAVLLRLAQEQKATAKEHPAIYLAHEIARLGRSARVHVVVGLQRPDQRYLGGGDLRGNLRGLRLSCGRLDAQGATMMWGDTSVGTELPDDAPGLAYVASGKAAPALARVLWTPPPARRPRPAVEA